MRDQVGRGKSGCGGTMERALGEVGRMQQHGVGAWNGQAGRQEADRQADQKKNRRTEGRWKDRHTNHVNGAALPTMLAKLSAIPQSIAGMLAVPKCRCCVRHPPVVRRRVVRSPGPPSLWCGWPPEASATGHRRRVVSAATLNDTTGTQVWVTSRAALLLHL